MSQRVWTCTCGWRTTAENAGVLQRGDAPQACRRCGATAFTVTSENHPKITLVCKRADCRQDFLGIYGGKFCPKCRATARALKAWEGRRKYEWTPERDQLLRDLYKGNPSELAPRFGWPKYAISHRAQQLGLCRVKEEPWTREQDAFLLEWAGIRQTRWMARQPILKGRTPTAVIVRLKRLHVSRRIQHDGLTMGQLETALGVDHRMIAGWVRSGRLPAKRVKTDRLPQQGGDPYVFADRDVAAFVLDNPSAFRLARVDQAWFMGLMRAASGRRDDVEAAS